MGHAEEVAEAEKWFSDRESGNESGPGASLVPQGALGGAPGAQSAVPPAGGVGSGDLPGSAAAAPGEGAGESTTAGDSPSYTKALEALMRGLPRAGRQKIIASLSEEEILEWGTSMAKTQAEQDKLGAEYGRLKSEKDTPAQTAEDSGEDTVPAEPSPKVEALDLSAVLEPFDLDLESEDLPKALTAVAQHVRDTMQTQFQNERKALRMEFGALRAVVDELRGEAVGRQLEGRFPQLRDPSTLADVLKRAEQYAHLKDFQYTPGASAAQKFKERVELAAEVHLARGAAQGKRAPVERAQPPVPTRPTVSSANGQRSEYEKAQAFLETHEATGGDRAAAERAYRS